MRSLLSMFVVLVLLSSCTKKKDDPVVSVDVTLNNVAGVYKITKAEATVSGITVNIFNMDAYFPPCQRDDIHTFTTTTSTTGNYVVTDAGVACSPSSASTNSYTVNTAARTITFGSETGNIVTLTASQMVVARTNYPSAGITATITYTRQ